MKVLSKISTLILIIIISSSISKAQVAVSTDGSNADESAMLEVKSTEKGFLPPRMTEEQRDAISNPATGLLVYITDQNSYYYYNGVLWIKISNINDSDEDWSFSGNNIYSSVSGNIGIGTSNPLNKLDVADGDINTSGVYKIENSTILTSPGSGSIFLGVSAGANSTSSSKNTFIGCQSGYYNSTAGNNTYIGYRSGYKNTTGEYNVLIGDRTGYNSLTDRNIMIGYYAGYDNSNGEYNTFIGYQAGRTNLGSDNLFIGYQAGYNETGSGKLYIENSNSTTPLIWGDFYSNLLVINGNSSDNTNNRTFFVNGSSGGESSWYSQSDIKLKRNIQTIPNALSKVLKLRGVNFEWKNSNTESGLQMGFIAQEVIEIIPEVVDNKGEYSSMQYSPLTALIIEAIKEQQKMIENQDIQLKELKKQNQKLQKRINNIEYMTK